MTAKCKTCAEENLYWVRRDGILNLCDPDGTRHDCKGWVGSTNCAIEEYLLNGGSVKKYQESGSRKSRSARGVAMTKGSARSAMRIARGKRG